MREQGERGNVKTQGKNRGENRGENRDDPWEEFPIQPGPSACIYIYLSAVAYDILTLQFLVYILQSNTKHLENIFLNLKNQSTFLSIKPRTEMYTILNSHKMKRSVAGEEKELNRDFKLHSLT